MKSLKTPVQTARHEPIHGATSQASPPLCPSGLKSTAQSINERSPEQLCATFGHSLHSFLWDLGEVGEVVPTAVKITGACGEERASENWRRFQKLLTSGWSINPETCPNLGLVFWRTYWRTLKGNMSHIYTTKTEKNKDTWPPDYRAHENPLSTHSKTLWTWCSPMTVPIV